MLTFPNLSSAANSDFVVCLSPVAIGILTCVATFLNSSILSGGIGSSNHKRLNSSNALPNLIAPEVVN